mmetsp:Transcript_43416/g.55761  ORF Transcript_43416/g.55761 Transcript_43416/m.55761 type:complete len:167 (-) Transcript_43416:115-615(-)
MNRETFTGRVYMIYDKTTYENYIGSTTKSLEKRLKQHEACFKSHKAGKSRVYMTSFEIIKNKNYTIMEVDTIEAQSIKELREFEAFFVGVFKGCVNKNIPGRTDEKYRHDNKDKRNEYDKHYRENNNEQIKSKKLSKMQSDALKWKNGDKTIKMSMKMFDYLEQLN